MSTENSQKVTASQLKRSAFLYVRQSTPRQVLEHTESTARQYALFLAVTPPGVIVDWKRLTTGTFAVAKISLAEESDGATGSASSQ